MNRRDHCVLCGGHVSHFAPELNKYRTCRVCDLTWYVEDPVESIGDWDKDYYGDDKTFEFHETRKSALAAIVARLSALCPDRGRLLDVGTGLGILMQAAAKDGWSVEGVEPSKNAAEFARRLTGDVVHQGFLEEVELPEGRYDAITMIDVLRTVPDPLTFLRSAQRLLRPAGVLLIRESYRKIAWRTRRLKGKPKNQSLKAMQRAFDYQCFSPKSLLYALREGGFTEGYVEPSPAFVERAPGDGLLIPLLKRAGGLASTILYRASGRGIIISPNLLAFGRASGGTYAVNRSFPAVYRA